MKISKNILGLAAEFAVASELCRRNIYAQLTLGAQKRTDLLIFDTENNRMLRIEVKAKQGRDWPNCKGIYGDNVLLVLVDYKDKREDERPDFYILTVEDWIDFVEKGIASLPEQHIEMNEQNVPIWITQVNIRGQPYKGMGVRPEQIQAHKERWDKVLIALGREGDVS